MKWLVLEKGEEKEVARGRGLECRKGRAARPGEGGRKEGRERYLCDAASGCTAEGELKGRWTAGEEEEEGEEESAEQYLHL